MPMTKEQEIEMNKLIEVLKDAREESKRYEERFQKSMFGPNHRKSMEDFLEAAYKEGAAQEAYSDFCKRISE